MIDDSEESEATGWHAIDEALYPIYGGIEPMHWGTILSWQFGGQDPIHGISAYRNNRSRNHLHYVTYGFTDLWEKQSDDARVSGFGFELTFRLAWDRDKAPPDWALNFLQNLGRYVFQTGRRFAQGHSMPLNGPIAIGEDTRIHAIAFSLDPELPPIDTDNGRVQFLQIVGLTNDELTAIQGWNAERFLELVQEENELLITDLNRVSHLADDQFAHRVNELTAAEGASAVALYSNEASFECVEDATCRLTLGALVVADLARRLIGRIPYGRPFSVLSDERAISFEPADHFGWERNDDSLRIFLTARQSQVVAELLKPHVGTYTSPSLPGLTVIVVKSRVKDRHGNVTREIG